MTDYEKDDYLHPLVYDAGPAGDGTGRGDALNDLRIQTGERHGIGNVIFERFPRQQR